MSCSKVILAFFAFLGALRRRSVSVLVSVPLRAFAAYSLCRSSCHHPSRAYSDSAGFRSQLSDARDEVAIVMVAFRAALSKWTWSGCVLQCRVVSDARDAVNASRVCTSHMQRSMRIRRVCSRAVAIGWHSLLDHGERL
jgi:hypothetical protein